MVCFIVTVCIFPWCVEYVPDPY